MDSREIMDDSYELVYHHMNYDKKRANSERGGNLGLADLRLEELKQYLLRDWRPWVFVNIPVDY